MLQKVNACTNSKIGKTIPSLLIIAIFFIIAYLLNLGLMPLTSPDEPRYAEIPREMIISHNWVVPQLDKVDYFQKPIFGYWATAVSELTFGENNFAVRFPSALAVFLSAILIYFFARKLTDEGNIPLLSAMAFLGLGIISGIGSYAVLDSLTSFFITASLVFFYFAYTERKSIWLYVLYLILSGAALGGCFLTKGFLAYVVVGISILSFMIWNRDWKRMFIMPWILLLSSFAIALPWSLEIMKARPDFWPYFFFQENLQRFFSAAKDRSELHPEPLWFFIPILIAGLLPLGFHFICAYKGLKNKLLLKNQFIRYSLCWIVLPFIFFSASSGKLATYILPCFPPAIILLTYGVYKGLDIGEKRIFNFVNWAIASIIGLALILVLIYSILVPNVIHRLPPFWNLGQCMIGISAIVVWIILLMVSIKMKSTFSKIIIFIIAPILALSFKFSLVPEQALAAKQQGKFILDQSQYITPNTIVISYPNMMHAVFWYLKNDKVYIFGGKGGELDHWLKEPQFKDRYIPTKRDLWHFIAEHKDNPGGIVFFMGGDFREATPPAPIEIYKYNRLFFAKFN